MNCKKCGKDLSKNVIVPVTPTVTVPTPTVEASTKGIDSATKLSTLITRGQQLISVRLTSLAAQKTKVTASKLTDEQKSTLIATIDANTTKLNDLLVQINAGTDLETVRAQVKSILTDYRIYGVVIAQAEQTRALLALSNHIDLLLNDTIVKIQARLDVAKAKGKDVTAKQAALDAAKAKLPEIKVTIQALIDKVNALTPADYPTTAKTVLTEVKTGTKTVRAQLLQLTNNIKAARTMVSKK